MLRMLATLLPIDDGRARIFGIDVREQPHMVRQLLGVTGQYASVDENLTAKENLWLFARLQGIPSARARATARQLLEQFGLEDAADRPISKFSGGMRRRLDLAASLITQPPLIFLDEPTTGLDPRTRGQMWDTIRGLVADGSTIVLTTQYLDEADQLADRIAVIDHGTVIAEGTPGQLKASVGSGALKVRLLDPEQRPDAERVLRRGLGHVNLEADPAALTATCADADRGALAVAELSRAGVRVADFSLGQPSLDEVFLALTGHTAERAEDEDAELEEAAA
jgi:ABC-2 type transport system ATP-binding protein